MRPGLLGSFINFAARYCAPTRNPHKFFMEYNGKEKLPEFNAILEVRRICLRPPLCSTGCLFLRLLMG